MLKFRDNYTTIVTNFEDFILLVYVVIDDLYTQYAPESVSRRRNCCFAKLSDSEIITISICGELMGIDSENAWYSFVKKNYRHLFPDFCSRTRFNRTRRNLLQVTEFLREKLLLCFPELMDNYCVIDSFPLSVCKFGRARYCRSFKENMADYGKCPSKKETYFGFKVHAMVTLQGYITAFEITPASVDDREGLKEMADGLPGFRIFADKGYAGKNLYHIMQEQGICLMALRPSNYKEQLPKRVRQTIFRFRRMVETIFSQLSGELNAERVLAKSFRGLCTRMVNKVLAHNLCMIFNHIFNGSDDIRKIKQLIF